MIFHNNANLHIEFPRGFLPIEITEKYNTYLNNNTFNNIFKDVLAYINHSIKSINVPGLNYSAVTQFKNRGREVQHRGNQPIQDLFEKDLNFEFKKMDGLLNYFILLEIFIYYYQHGNDNINIKDPLILHILDTNDNITASFTFTDFIIDDLDALDLDFSENDQRLDTFTLKCKFNQIQINILGHDIL